MDNPPEERDAGVECIGPFSTTYYRVTVGGYKVPNIIAHLKPGTDDQWSLILDERYGLDCSQEELERWMWWVANAMAISAGWTCFGKNARRDHPFDCRMIGISSVEVGDSIDEEPKQPFDGLDSE